MLADWKGRLAIFVAGGTGGVYQGPKRINATKASPLASYAVTYYRFHTLPVWGNSKPCIFASRTWTEHPVRVGIFKLMHFWLDNRLWLMPTVLPACIYICTFFIFNIVYSTGQLVHACCTYPPLFCYMHSPGNFEKDPTNVVVDHRPRNIWLAALTCLMLVWYSQHFVIKIHMELLVVSLYSQA